VHPNDRAQLAVVLALGQLIHECPGRVVKRPGWVVALGLHLHLHIHVSALVVYSQNIENDLLLGHERSLLADGSSKIFAFPRV
jgi:hypothetical protein